MSIPHVSAHSHLTILDLWLLWLYIFVKYIRLAIFKFQTLNFWFFLFRLELKRSAHKAILNCLAQWRIFSFYPWLYRVSFLFYDGKTNISFKFLWDMNNYQFALHHSNSESIVRIVVFLLCWKCLPYLWIQYWLVNMITSYKWLLQIRDQSYLQHTEVKTVRLRGDTNRF